MSVGIPLTSLDECQEIAVTVDGADEVDPQLRLIKGGGGALLREKIVASATMQMVVVADASKRVERLGKFPLPVEVIKFAQTLVAKRISTLGAEVSLRTNPDGSAFVTDENNHILDCRFGEIQDPDALARQLSEMPGVVEHGLFIGVASVALFARGSEIMELRR
jgi:ribose 5-phosphate isomerase A